MFSRHADAEPTRYVIIVKPIPRIEDRYLNDRDGLRLKITSIRRGDPRTGSPRFTKFCWSGFGPWIPDSGETLNSQPIHKLNLETLLITSLLSMKPNALATMIVSCSLVSFSFTGHLRSFEVI